MNNINKILLSPFVAIGIAFGMLMAALDYGATFGFNLIEDLLSKE